MAVAGPVLQEIGEFREFKKVVQRLFFNRRGARDSRYRIDQLGRLIGGATGLAVVAILIGRLAFRTGTTNVAVGQKDIFFRVKRLHDGALGDVIISH